MLTRFKKGIQRVAGCLIAIFLSPIVYSQPTFLQPEITTESGLKSNSVRTIEKDGFGRMWIGTDLGLNIVNYQDRKLTEAVETIGNTSIWTIAFLKEYAFVGSRFKGVYVINLKRSEIVQHFDSVETGLSRRFRVIGDTVFLATKGDPIFFTYKSGQWVATRVPTYLSEGFVTDFTRWNGTIYASAYSISNRTLLKFDYNKFVPANEWNLSHPKLAERVGLCLSIASSDTALYVGGDGFIFKLSNTERIKDIEIIQPKTFKYFPVWDIVTSNGNVYYTVGNTENLQEGMLFTGFKYEASSLQPNFYGLSLHFDGKKQILYTGTENRGVFVWPYSNKSSYISEHQKEQPFKFKPIAKDCVILFNKAEVLVKDLGKDELLSVFKTIETSNTIDDIVDVNYKDSQLYILRRSSIYHGELKGKKSKLEWNTMYMDPYNKLLLKKNQLYLFTSYFDQLTIIDILKKSHTTHSIPSNQVSFPNSSTEKIIYHSSYSGFYLFDTTVHSLNIPEKIIESYAVADNRVWLLQSGVVKCYRFSLDGRSAKLLYQTDLQKLCNGWKPKWIFSLGNKVFVANPQGVLQIDIETGSPYGYTYLGNYSEGASPAVLGSSVFFYQHNYITVLSADDLLSRNEYQSIDVSFIPNGSIYQNTPVRIVFHSNDYLLLNHELKKVELWQNESLRHTYYTLSSAMELPYGLDAGNYTIKVLVNGRLLDEREFKVQLPLTSNPLFYLGLMFLLIAILSLGFKAYFDKKMYQRKVLENKLQLLKQNLNPHFIFNSLNLIYSLVLQQKNDAAVRTIGHFSDLHRYYLDIIHQNTILLSRELNFIESYLVMESERVVLDDPFIYHLPAPIPNEIAELPVPPLIMQPIVENAVKYSSADSSTRELWIDIERRDNHVVIGVENTLSQSREVHAGKGIGLSLVKERIEIFNRVYHGNILFVSDTNAKHTVLGYRSEIWLQYDNSDIK